MLIQTLFLEHIMNLRAKIMASLVVLAFLGGCTEHKPINTTTDSITIKKDTTPHRQLYYSHPPRLPGQWTVADIVQDYSASTKGKLNPYFTKAKVSYPPKEVTLIALKQEKKLELWARDSGEFRFIRNYNIQATSGVAGPKLRQGDKQVPEGIYRIAGLNPNSHYHLSMKINYPNEFDLFHAGQEGRTAPGSDIFIHGKAVSIGCLAMGDEVIDELFVLTAQVGADNVKVVIAPHDPRNYPLKPASKSLPKWTPVLYSIISQEMKPYYRR
jgi:hypothetical protein